MPVRVKPLRDAAYIRKYGDRMGGAIVDCFGIAVQKKAMNNQYARNLSARPQAFH